MKIQSLVLSNFKSFSENVSLENVSEEANIFVGKNGAGKSSIISAIQFVITPHWKISLPERKAIVSENSSEIHSYVEIVFENEDKAFPGGPLVAIRRTITQRAEEYCVDGRTVSREEMASLFSTVGITRAVPYYIVEQGKIGQLAQMNGAEKMALIREMAGHTMYEKNKEEGQKILESSLEIEEKIRRLLEEVEQRVSAAQDAKIKREEKEELERKRELLMREIYKRELNKVRARLEELFEEESAIDATAEENVEMLQLQLESILSQVPPENVSMHISSESIDISYLEKEVGEKRKKAALLRQEISRLESLFSVQAAVKEEINALRLQGETAVKKKIESIKDMLEESSADKHLLEKEKLLEERRSIWREEKELQKKKKCLEKEMEAKEGAFLMANNTFLAENELRALPGALGYVYTLIAIPGEILLPLSQAQSHVLTSIVVDTKESALFLARKHKIDRAIIPLHSIEKRKCKQVPLPSLSSYISCTEKYALLVEYLFGNIYFVSDFEAAQIASKQYGVSIITAAGEYFNRAGTITSGEEGASTKFQRFIWAKEEYRKCIAQEGVLSNKKVKNDTLCAAIFAAESSSVFYLQDMLYLLEHEEIDVDSSLLEKRMHYEQKILPSLQSSEKNLSDAINEKKQLEEIEYQKKKAAEIESKLSRIIGSVRWKDKRAERYRLESRFRKLQKKILSLNAEEAETLTITPSHSLVLQKAPKESLIESLSLLQRQIMALPEENGRTEHLVKEYTRIIEKIEELQAAKKKIVDMQRHLEMHKEEITNITVQQVKENLVYFFRALTHGTARVTASPENLFLEIEVSFGGEPYVSLEELSGGQRSILALCMILSLQSIYPAPFYLLDEFDANLDVRFLQNIIGSGILGGKQLFISTFRGETLLLGKKFYHVANRNVQECSSAEAQEFLFSYLPESIHLGATE